MKEKLTKNLGLKILSLFVAVLLWIVILNVDDPVVSEPFDDITVTKINENELKQKDKTYEVISGETVDVVVKAKRSIIQNLRKSDIQAVADLSQLSVVNATTIDVTIPRYGDLVEIKQNISTMKVSLENLITDQFRINIVANGTVSAGYYVKDKTSSPNMMLVRGAESVVKQIKEVVVDVDVTNARASFLRTAIPKVYDMNGKLMDSDKISLNYEEVAVTVNLLQTKTVNLFIELTGEPAPGYEYVNFEYEPKEVTIAGEQSELEKVQYIKGEYNIDNKRDDVEESIDISDFIKNDVILIDENKNAVINIDIEKKNSKDIHYNSTDIEMKNLKEGYVAELNPEDLINVVIYGKEDILSGINKYNLKPYIDLTNIKPGVNIVDVQFNTEEDVTLNKPSVIVMVSEASG